MDPSKMALLKKLLRFLSHFFGSAEVDIAVTDRTTRKIAESKFRALRAKIHVFFSNISLSYWSSLSLPCNCNRKLLQVCLTVPEYATRSFTTHAIL
jgi:hypothetical protein